MKTTRLTYSGLAVQLEASLTSFCLQAVKPVREELCIYGDLLTMLGTRQDKDYLHNLDSLDQVQLAGGRFYLRLLLN
jgi:hypothetical protein